MRRFALALVLLLPIAASSAPTTVAGRMPVATYPLRASANLPPCNATESCVMDCHAEEGVWECVDATGEALGVTAGTGTTFLETEWGWVAQIDADAEAPSIDSVRMEAILPGGSAAFYNGAYSVFAVLNAGVLVAGAAQGAWAHQSGNGGTSSYSDATSHYGRHHAGGATGQGIVASSRARWTAVVVSVSSAGAPTTRAGGAENNTSSAAAAPSAPGTPLYFGRLDPASGAGTNLGGWLARFRIYSKALSLAERKELEARAFGTVGSPGKVPDIARASTAWAEAADGKVYAYASNVGRVHATWGWLIEAARTNYWINSTAIDTGHTALGTPTVTANTEEGPLSTTMGVAEADTLSDNDAGVGEGYYVTTPAQNGGWAMSCYMKAGTASSASLRIGVSAGTGPLTCTHTLTSSWARYACSTTLAGTAGSVDGDVWVGSTAAVTGTIIVSHCQLEFAGASIPGFPTSPIVSGGTAVQRVAENVLFATTGYPKADYELCGTVRWPWANAHDPNSGAMTVDTSGPGNAPPGMSLMAYWAATTGVLADGRRSNSIGKSYTPAALTDYRICGRNRASKMFACANNACGSASPTATVWGEGHSTPARFGSYGATALFLNGYLRDVTVGP